MSAKFPRYPARPHVSGQARIVLNGKSVYLGKHNSPESRTEYARLLAEWHAARGEHAAALQAAADPATAAPARTVAEAVGLYWHDFSERARRPDGTRAREAKNVWFALRPLRLFFADRLLADFRAADLVAYRRYLIAGYPDPLAKTTGGRRRPCCRQVVNHHVSRVRACFRRLEVQGLAPPGLAERLRALPPLLRGEEGAREAPKKALPDLLDLVALWCHTSSPAIRALVLVQLHTAARPSELLGLRAGDLERVPRSPVLRAVLTAHKTAWRGKERVLYFGPRAQAALAPLLTGAAPTDFLFSPARSLALRAATLRARRRTRVQPSQQTRARPVAERQRPPRERYDDVAYHHALVAPGARAAARCGTAPLTPYRIRHLAATRIAQHPQGGPDLARQVLGHALPGVTGTYVHDKPEAVVAWMAAHG